VAFISGLEGVIAAETVLSDVDGAAGRLTLRGHLLEDIAGRRSLEWLVAELWRGFVPGEQSEASVRSGLGAARVAAFTTIAPLLPQAAQLAPIEALRLLAASVPDDAPELPLRLAATLAVGLAGALRLRRGSAPVAPDPALGHAADLMRMMAGAPAAPARVAALETYLLTAADHGLNASTFTARVVASTAAGLSSSVTAALCALKGPLHGGAPGPVIDMLDAIGTPGNAEAWLEAAVARGDRLMGFGHRVYRVTDPRSEIMKRVVAGLGLDGGRLHFAEAIERAALAVLARRKPGRSLQTNLEFYTALLLEALEVPRDAFTGIFAAARVFGWIAHALEQAGQARLIRPQSRYVGPRLAA
jgi:citrate synthase